MAGNSNLASAMEAKQDEFYTQLRTIEDELRHYRKHFKGKTVLCNCDDPFESNFFKYFALNFNKLGLKKLIATCYAGSSITGTQLSLFGSDTDEQRKTPYKAIVTTVHDANGNGGVDMLDVAELFRNGENKLERLEGDGDFRSPECLELLDEADVVVTNPPFSLFREYIATLVAHNKKFVVIGNQNAITYKEIFPLIKDNELWLGYHSGHTLFEVPDTYGIPDFYDKNDRQKLRSNGYVIDWVQAIFPKYRKEMKGLPWGLFYNEHRDRTDLDPKALEADVSRLMADEDVTKKGGVYEYLLTGKERCLSIRAFDDRMKRAAYERQGGVCPYCGEHFELSEMHADHIKPWAKGGPTTAENCQMLCRDCNLKKSDD